MSEVSANPNIAFIKYWGKLSSTCDEDRNLATNASLSMTLHKARTQTRFEFSGQSATTKICIGQKPASTADVEKTTRHVHRVLQALQHRTDLAFSIESENNFPQGTGIASSASAFAALTFAVALEVLGPRSFKEFHGKNLALLSELARQGSGSASRSVAGPFMKWEGKAATLFPARFGLRDTILIFSRDHKKVPSSEGHLSAQSSPLFSERLLRLPARLKQLEQALLAENLGTLGPLLEEEALELHEIARTGTPAITYLSPESSQFIEFLRLQKQRDFYFTLDAGPNVHLISERDISADLKVLLAKLNLKCEIWEDEQGFGPEY